MSADGQERLGQGGGAGGAGRPARRVPKFRRRAEARPDEVLDAALDLFIEKGFAATRVEDIAKRAGLSKGADLSLFPVQGSVDGGRWCGAPWCRSPRPPQWRSSSSRAARARRS